MGRLGGSLRTGGCGVVTKHAVVAVAFVVGAAAWAGVGGAWARPSPPSGGSQPGAVTCVKVSGKVHFDPPLTDTGASRSEMAVVRISLKGCKASGGGATPRSAVAATDLPVPTSNCKDLKASSTTATSLAIEWSPSTLGVSQVTFPGYTPMTGPTAGFVLGGHGTSVHGSYPGTDKGASSTATLSMGSATPIAKACRSKGGLASADISGSVSLG